MHPARLTLLADRHAQTREIVSRREDATGNYYALECGHQIKHASHFALSKDKTMRCTECGKTFVRNSPLYAKEFVK